jgi:thiazole/oxazole-forming peptide maturase SagC family component
MKLEIDEKKLFFQPTQILEIDQVVILKRGVNQVKIEGESAIDVVKVIVTLASEDGATEEELLDYFGGTDSDRIRNVLRALIDKGFLVSKGQKQDFGLAPDEFRQEIFFEALGIRDTDLHRLQEKKIAIIGVNAISRQMARALRNSQLSNFDVIDNPLFRNIGLFTNEGRLHPEKWDDGIRMPLSYQEWMAGLSDTRPDILVCTSDFGGMQLMRDFNKFCVENDVLFLPVVLQDFRGWIGPLVIPRETACYECTLSRQNSLMPDHDIRRSIELSAYEGQEVIGFHPSMASILGDMAVMELTKLFAKILNTWNVGHLIEVNMLKTEIKSRRILKVPRCPVCGEMNRLPRISVQQSTFTPTHED